jgi:hypothetical protein
MFFTADGYAELTKGVIDKTSRLAHIQAFVVLNLGGHGCRFSLF